jgi:hypothetical protein
MFNIDNTPGDTATVWHDTRPTDGSSFRLFYAVTNDYAANVRFLSVYLSDPTHAIELLRALSTDPQFMLRYFDGKGAMGMKNQGEIGGSVGPLPFSGTIYIYTELQLPLDFMGEMDRAFSEHGASVHFRSTDYALAIWDKIRLDSIKPINKYELRGNPPLIEPVMSK